MNERMRQREKGTKYYKVGKKKKGHGNQDAVRGSHMTVIFLEVT